MNARPWGAVGALPHTDQLAGCNVTVSRLAQGVLGGELDYLDEGTLACRQSAEGDGQLGRPRGRCCAALGSLVVRIPGATLNSRSMPGMARAVRIKKNW